jgi:DNA-binding transcriptional LysR family regulator
MALQWDDLRLFLDVARLGGLTPASRTTGLSAATLGRRITALERDIGRPLFVRAQTGYTLTPDGEELLERAAGVETAMASVVRLREGYCIERVVRISAGWWTSMFLSAHIGALWRVEDRIAIELVTANAKVDIARRRADIGIRNARPTEIGLAGRLTGRTAYALYAGRNLINGVEAGFFVGSFGDGAQTASARWLEAHHGDRIAVRGNDPMAVRELVAAGAGLTVLPCFAADTDPRLVRVAGTIAELETEQWLVTHNEERHDPVIRRLADAIAGLMRRHAPLLRGERPYVEPSAPG